MSETLLKFMLDELQIVRVVCGKADCGAIHETRIEDLPKMFAEGRCRFCGNYYKLPSDQTNHIALLARTMGAIAANKDLYRIEFVLPQKASEPAK